MHEGLIYIFFYVFYSCVNTFMFVKLLNNKFLLFINNIFQYYKIILEHFYSNVRVALHWY
jgi:hypothetical protein